MYSASGVERIYILDCCDFLDHAKALHLDLLIERKCRVHAQDLGQHLLQLKSLETFFF